jgi:hypothetical protein
VVWLLWQRKNPKALLRSRSSSRLIAVFSQVASELTNQKIIGVSNGN